MACNHGRRVEDLTHECIDVIVLNDGSVSHVDDHASKELRDEALNREGKEVVDLKSQKNKASMKIHIHLN